MLDSGEDNPKIAHSRGRCGPASNTWILGATRICPHPNGVSIDSTVFAALKDVTNRHTDTQITLLRLSQ